MRLDTELYFYIIVWGMLIIINVINIYTIVQNRRTKKYWMNKLNEVMDRDHDEVL